jgi:hypothetical protein
MMCGRIAWHVRLPTYEKFAANTMARVHIIRSKQNALKLLRLLLCLCHSIAQAQSGEAHGSVPHQQHDSAHSNCEHSRRWVMQQQHASPDENETAGCVYVRAKLLVLVHGKHSNARTGCMQSLTAA